MEKALQTGKEHLGDNSPNKAQRFHKSQRQSSCRPWPTMWYQRLSSCDGTLTIPPQTPSRTTAWLLDAHGVPASVWL